MIKLTNFVPNKDEDSLVIEGKAFNWDHEDLEFYFGHYAESVSISRANFQPGGNGLFRVHLNDTDPSDELIERIKEQVPEEERPRDLQSDNGWRGLSIED